MKNTFLSCLLFALLVLTCGTRAQADANPAPIVRENIEWANLWFPHAKETALPHVLLIGDSITNNYYNDVEKALTGKAYVARMATSHFVSDPLLPGLIKLYLGQMKFDVIQFNNGMHGWDHSEAEYRAAFPAFLAAIQDNAQGAKLIWASTTPVSVGGHPEQVDAARTDRVKARNAIAHELVSQAGIPEDDLFTLMLAHPELHDAGGIHFTKQGEAMQGQYVAQQIEKYLPAPPPDSPAAK
jgi:hypothetical protein